MPSAADAASTCLRIRDLRAVDRDLDRVLRGADAGLSSPCRSCSSSVLGRSVFADRAADDSVADRASAIAAPFAGRLADQVPAGLLGGIGLAIFAAGLFALSRLGPVAGDLDIAWRMALCGIGFGLFQSPNNRTIISAAPTAALRRRGRNAGDRAAARPDHRCVVVGIGFPYPRRRRGSPSCSRPPASRR